MGRTFRGKDRKYQLKKYNDFRSSRSKRKVEEEKIKSDKKFDREFDKEFNSEE